MSTTSDELRALERFYTTRIPEQFNRALELQSEAEGDDAAKTLEAMRAVDTALRIRVFTRESKAPNEFVLEIDGGRMTATRESKLPILFTLEHDERALRVLESESGDSILGFLAGMSGVGSELRLTRGRVALLREIEGSIRFERSGASPFSLQLHFREPHSAEPDCSLRMDDETHRALRAGELDAQDAFMTQQVLVEGDMQMAMQIAIAFISSDD